MRSAWRGEARNTSMPNLARSLWAAPVAIISIAQQARPNVAGNIDLVRAHRAALPTGVMRKLGGPESFAIKPPFRGDTAPGGGWSTRGPPSSRHRQGFRARRK